MTSHPGAVDRSWLAGEGFAPVLLERMSPLDVAAFCRRWHDAMRDAAQRDAVVLPCCADELPEYERALLRQLDGRRHLRGLASSPLLCAMICALNLDCCYPRQQACDLVARIDDTPSSGPPAASRSVPARKLGGPDGGGLASRP